MSTFAAIYENGVFRPLIQIDLPERAIVNVSIPDAPSPAGEGSLELLALVERLHGSFSLPAGKSDDELIADARAEKYARD